MRCIHVCHSQLLNQILEYIYVKPCTVEPGYSELKDLAVLSGWTDCFTYTHLTRSEILVPRVPGTDGSKEIASDRK